MSNNFTILPELILVDFISNTLQWLRDDIETNTATPQNSYIYKLFKPLGEEIKLQRYNYYLQAKEILSRDVDHNRYIKVHTDYDFNKEKVPVLIIAEEGDEIYENNLGSVMQEGDDYTYPVYSKIRRAQYTITIHEDNQNEVTLLYHLIKSIFLTFSPSLQLMGLMELEVRAYKKEKVQNAVPDHYFTKRLFIDFLYQHNSPTVDTLPTWSEWAFSGTMIDEEENNN